MHLERFVAGFLTAPAPVIRSGDPEGESIRFPVPVHVIEHGEHRVLVDTGLNPAAVPDVVAYYGVAPATKLFAFEQAASIADQIDLSAITLVVLTHLHWDHVGGLSLLAPDVPVVLQRREWVAGGDDAEIASNFYFPRDYAADPRPVTLIDGDHDLFGDGGVELLATPGHTPGHQSVRAGRVVIGGDVAHFDAGLDDHRFPAFGHDTAQQQASADRLRALRDGGLTVLPGHDPASVVPGRWEI